MGVYDLLDEQTWEYIIFFLAVFGMVLYAMATGFMLVSQIGGRFVLYKKEDPLLLTDNLPGVSIIKPLMGVDPLLEINLETHFQINYPKYELLCCVQDDQDPAINLVEKLKERYPKVDCKLFIGGKDGIINPMVHNMAPAYDNAQYEYVWISTSRIRVSTDIMLDLVCKLQKPNVALCHQMPFATDQKGFAQSMEKVYFGGAFARYYLAFNILGLCCATGMSYMFKKQILDELNGLNWYGKYLAEDFFLTQAMHTNSDGYPDSQCLPRSDSKKIQPFTKNIHMSQHMTKPTIRPVQPGETQINLRTQGFRLVLSSYPAQQSLAQTSVLGYKDRMVRWLRLRLNMMPLVSGFLEPLTECIPLGFYGAWCLHRFLGINPFIFYPVHVGLWLVSDYFQLRMIQNGPLLFSKMEFVLCWILREFVAIWIYFEGLVHPRTIRWGKRTYRLSLGGHTEIVNPLKLHRKASVS